MHCASTSTGHSNCLVCTPVTFSEPRIQFIAFKMTQIAIIVTCSVYMYVSSRVIRFILICVDIACFSRL